MKNLKNALLKQCIFMSERDFCDLVYRLAHWNVECYTYEGVCMDDDELEEVFDGEHFDFERELKEILGDYFGVTVSSIHTDNCEEEVGVWIVCVNERTRSRDADR